MRYLANLRAVICAIMVAALELAAALGRIEGVQPAVTRTGDTFVPLQDV